MIAMTTSSSINVKPVSNRVERRASVFAVVAGTPEDPSRHIGPQEKSIFSMGDLPQRSLAKLVAPVFDRT